MDEAPSETTCGWRGMADLARRPARPTTSREWRRTCERSSEGAATSPGKTTFRFLNVLIKDLNNQTWRLSSKKEVVPVSEAAWLMAPRAVGACVSKKSLRG